MFAGGAPPSLLCLACVACGACGEPAAHVHLAPLELPNACGKPDAAQVTAVRVIAYRPGLEVRRTDTEIADFPADTEQLGVELVGGANQVIATGKTAVLDYNDLTEGAAIPIAMLPPVGFCRVNDMAAPRAHPLVARAGRGVLVVGAVDVDGTMRSTAEFYDPATAEFAPVELPGVLGDDPSAFVGAAAATLDDGRVVLSGGQALTVFDPVSLTFSSPALISRRLEHAAFGVDGDHVLVTGGCLAAGTTCDASATPLHSSLEYELDAAGKIVGDGVAKPPLPGTSTRYGARIFDAGVVADGKRQLVVAGASSDSSTVDRIPFAQGDGAGAATVASGTHAQVTGLDGGALLTAFAVDGAAMPDGAASILPPGAGDAVPVALAPELDGARLVTAEDGSVFAIGGDAALWRYVPTTNTWLSSTPPGDPPGTISAPSLVRLDDGTVLVVGGTVAGAASASAWLFRPSLVGPQSGQVFAFADGSGAILTTPAPATANRTATTLELVAPGDDLTARALVGGPRPSTGLMTALVQVTAGGVALIAEQTGPSRMLVARLVPGEPARIDRVVGGTTTTLCSGSMVTAGELGLPLQLAVTSDGVSVAFGASGEVVKVSCDLGADPIALERGAWGIAATAGATVAVAAITVAR